MRRCPRATSRKAQGAVRRSVGIRTAARSAAAQRASRWREPDVPRGLLFRRKAVGRPRCPKKKPNIPFKRVWIQEGSAGRLPCGRAAGQAAEPRGARSEAATAGSHLACDACEGGECRCSSPAKSIDTRPKVQTTPQMGENPAREEDGAVGERALEFGGAGGGWEWGARRRAARGKEGRRGGATSRGRKKSAKVVALETPVAPLHVNLAWPQAPVQDERVPQRYRPYLALRAAGKNRRLAEANRLPAKAPQIRPLQPMSSFQRAIEDLDSQSPAQHVRAKLFSWRAPAPARTPRSGGNRVSPFRRPRAVKLGSVADFSVSLARFDVA